MNEGPSIAAIVVPWDPASALERVGRALAARGMVPHRATLPAGYVPTPGEWLGALALPLPPLRRGREHFPNAALISSDVPGIFTLAMWLSAANPDEVIVGWRRFSGFDPCAKVFWGGKPRWKDGDDPDHEVGFAVPKGAPAEVRPPSEPRVPLEAATLSGLLISIVKPLREPIKAGGAAWLHERSMLR